jgi:putative chitinase
MPLHVTKADWREIFPKAPAPVIAAFVDDAASLEKAGITATRTRLSYALANVEHECGGYAVRDLTENINYSAERMAEVWPSRFESAQDVKDRFGTAPGWQKKAFDEIYGGRMGNRKNTDDGSKYIGRGGPQVTGRDGYHQVGKRCGLNLVDSPELATRPEHQPAILAAFWSWKRLSAFADGGDFKGCVKAWNGGTNGLADRLERMKGNDLTITRLSSLASILPALDQVSSK